MKRLEQTVELQSQLAKAKEQLLQDTLKELGLDIATMTTAEMKEFSLSTYREPSYEELTLSRNGFSIKAWRIRFEMDENKFKFVIEEKK